MTRCAVTILFFLQSSNKTSIEEVNIYTFGKTHRTHEEYLSADMSTPYSEASENSEGDFSIYVLT